MKKKLLAFLTVLIMSGVSKAQTWTTIDSLLTTNLSKYNNALVAMVMHNDSLVYYKALGGYDSLTVVPIASCSKSFSAGLILRLAQDGFFSLDDSIGTYLPFATINGKGNSTIRQNFSHTAGWSGNTEHIYSLDRTLTLQQAADSIIKYDNIIYQPGTAFRYGGVSMHVAGAVAEVAAGQSWVTLFNNKIKTPLGLTNTNYSSTTNPLIAGGIKTNAADIMRYAQFILHNGKNPSGVQVVDSIWMQEMWKDQTNMAPVISAPYPFNPPYNNPYNADTIRYGIGTWLDIYNPTKNYQEQISGGGAFGTIFWINRCNNTTGVILNYSKYVNVWQTTFQAIDVVNSIYPNQCYQVVTSIDEPSSHNSDFVIYPNPTTGTIEISFTDDNQIFDIFLYNTLGERLLAVKNQRIINLRKFANGIYFISLRTGNKIMTKK